jgi:hypothetical protein
MTKKILTVTPISERQARRTRHAIARTLGVNPNECPLTFKNNVDPAKPTALSKTYSSEYIVHTPEPIEIDSIQGVPEGVEISTGGKCRYRLLPRN